jgi:glycosyltransferase involved in cell wall biosynthesis
MTILYISQNGVTTHIGGSQVAPYLLGLARAGFDIHLLSAEPVGQKKRMSHYLGLFNEAGIRWTRVTYRNKPPILGPVITQLRLSHAANRIVANGGVAVVHCRSHPTAIIGYRLKQRHGVKFIFDFRDFYADWGLQNTTGFKRFLYRRIKQLEGPMVQSADKTICLTRRACTILNDAYLGGRAETLAAFQVVPCCADFSHFDPSKVRADTIRSIRRDMRLPEDAFVLLYLGSLGTDYLLQHMVALYRQLLRLKPKAYFLFVSNNGDAQVYEAFEQQGISIERIRFTTAQREAVPAYIALAALSVVFIRADHTKAGCSPTKLAELFACNIPVIANPGVGDLDNIIDLSKNGSVMARDFSDEGLLQALEKVIACKEGDTKPVNIRENSWDFSLEQGIIRYQQVYRELLKLS